MMKQYIFNMSYLETILKFPIVFTHNVGNVVV